MIISNSSGAVYLIECHMKVFEQTEAIFVLSIIYNEKTYEILFFNFFGYCLPCCVLYDKNSRDISDSKKYGFLELSSCFERVRGIGFQ